MSFALKRDMQRLSAEQPMLKLLIPLVVGIFLRLYFFPLQANLTYISLIITLAVVVFWFLISSRLYKSIALYLCFACLGFSISNIQIGINQPFHFANQKQDFLLCRISDNPYTTGKFVSFMLQAIGNENNKPCSGNIKAYFKNDSLPTLQYGDMFWVSNSLIDELQDAPNPHQFNFKKFWNEKYVYHQTFIHRYDIIFIENSGLDFYKFIYTCTNYLNLVLDKYVLGTTQKSVAKGIVLGNAKDIDRDTQATYSLTGATHILSVSGLHIGIVTALLHFIFSIFIKRKKYQFIKIISITVILVLYGLLTGASPSVVRSVIMFVLMLIGHSYFPNVNFLNIVWVSAFILLIGNAGYIFDLGFQLSYAAVIGIVILFPLIKNLLVFNNSFLQKIWEMTAVSICAQIATLPILLCYFNTLSIVSLLSNLIVIPLSSLVLYLGMLLFVLHPISYVAFGIGCVMSFTIQFMNYFLEILIQFPYSFIQNITLHPLQSVLIYFFIFMLILWLIYKIQIALPMLLVCILFFVGFEVNERIVTLQQHSLVIYSLKKGVAIDYIKGDSLFTYQKNVLNNDIISKCQRHRTYMQYKTQTILNYTDFINKLPPQLLSVDTCAESLIAVCSDNYHVCNSGIRVSNTKPKNYEGSFYNLRQKAWELDLK